MQLLVDKRALDEEELKSRGLVFDTSLTNAGLHTCACTILERTLGKNLAQIGCKQHVLKPLLPAFSNQHLELVDDLKFDYFTRFH